MASSAVIDSGLARIASHSPWSGLPALEVARISQASANQRAGRAGRTGPGRAIRLYPLEDFVRRPAQDVPQILREDLTPTALLLQAMNLNLGSLDWLDAPPAAAVEHAHDLLRQLGATGDTAREMARYPLHPRLSRLMVEARRRGRRSRGLCGGGVDRRGRSTAGSRDARLAIGPSGAGGRGVVALCGAAVPSTGRVRARASPAPRRSAKTRCCSAS